MKKTRLIQILTYLLLILPFVLLATYWQVLPDKIPSHWDINGKIDEYGPKLEILLFPFMNLGVYLLIWGLVKIDPKKNLSKYKNTLDILLFVTVAFLTINFMIVFSITLNWITPESMPNSLTYIMCIFFVVFGNYMGKIRPNYFIGIRTPWTLESEEVWVKIHRLTGKIWVFLGLISLIILAIIPIYKKWVLVGFLLGTAVSTVFLYFYSYWLYRNLSKNNLKS